MADQSKNFPIIKQLNKLQPADVIVLFIRKKSNDLVEGLQHFFPDNTLIAGMCGNNPFDGARATHKIHYLPKELNYKALVLIGLGRSKKKTAEGLRESIAEAVLKCAHQKWANVLLVFPTELRNAQIFCESLVQGIWYPSYRFDTYKSNAKKETLSRFFIWNGSKKIPQFDHALKNAAAVMHGVWITKDLANQPPNSLNPRALKDFIVTHFKKYPNIEVLVKNRKTLEVENFNLLLGVSGGSVHEPYLVEINYHPKMKTKTHLALVGKGVTFDSGGLSLKPSASMVDMKYDMSGAATVIGLMDVVARTQPNVKISACIGTVENMMGAKAYRPGDVIFGYAGKSVEILNTDAEGRLVLADALAYTEKKHKPDYMIDFATLTGACYVALGDQYAGLFCDNKKLRQTLIHAGKESGDKLWPMPLDAAYHKSLKSSIADIKNIGDRWGGAITAAKFLEFFIAKTAWAHIDIAGLANDLTAPAYNTKNASGFGVRLISKLIEKQNN